MNYEVKIMQVVIDKNSLLFKFNDELNSDKINKIVKSVEQELDEEVEEMDFIEFAKKISKPVKDIKFNRDEIYEERVGFNR